MLISSVATSLNAMREFWAHMSHAEDILDLRILQWEKRDCDLVFTSKLMVRLGTVLSITGQILCLRTALVIVTLATSTPSAYLHLQ